MFGLFFGLWARRAQMTPIAGEEDRNRSLRNYQFSAEKAEMPPNFSTSLGSTLWELSGIFLVVFTGAAPRLGNHHADSGYLEAWHADSVNTEERTHFGLFFDFGTEGPK